MSYGGHPDQKWGHTSFAQHGDDFMILNLFGLIGIEKPSYLDIGAHHPTNISNTALLYQRGSRGVNVEANPLLIEEFKILRPEDKNICNAVGPERGFRTFTMFSPTSGRNTFDQNEVDEMVWAGFPIQGVMEVEMVTINDIVAEHCDNKWPSLLLTDIEGLDFDVLHSADFKNTAPKIIVTETRRHNGEAMHALMNQKGYRLYCRMWENLFFVREDLEHLVY